MTFTKHSTAVPYSDPPSRLQTLDIWLPRPLEETNTDESLWIIYIHGGAWRDPLQTSSCADATITHLSALPSIAGIASLNYRLSPYPSHPTDPSSPDDTERNVAHPTHVRDIATGIAYLKKEYGVKRWLGLGHSCGATMLCHYVSGIGLESPSDGDGEGGGGPEALLLSAGIYNLPLFVRNHAPPACPENIAQIYQAIVRGAFGDDEKVWQSVSPVAGKYGKDSWRDGKLIVLGHSYEDELVERQQRDVMCVALDREGWSIVMEDGDDEANPGVGGRVLEVRDIKGKHDFGWRDGEQHARLIEEVVQRLTQ